MLLSILSNVPRRMPRLNGAVSQPFTGVAVWLRGFVLGYSRPNSKSKARHLWKKNSFPSKLLGANYSEPEVPLLALAFSPD